MIRKLGIVAFLLTVIAFLLNTQLQRELSLGQDYSEEFESKYGESLDAYSPIGDEYFAARWLDEEEESKRDCTQYEFCSFMEIITLEECARSMEIKYALVGKNDEFVKSMSYITAAPKPGEKVTVEIGANVKEDFEYFRPDNIRCSEEPLEG